MAFFIQVAVAIAAVTFWSVGIADLLRATASPRVAQHHALFVRGLKRLGIAAALSIGFGALS